ncbi:S-layer homology domain-containing protein [Agathobaculum butyriciproducens]|uniref:S-layer homology domain-containing protein n=3 Tax=Agathobaculum butyriciproducens TaxID=1628085 RepID=A0AAW4VXH6_9FIRM|nr:S-layer homology domain-containing protein [Agathobaculum butyriciproducens]
MLLTMAPTVAFAADGDDEAANTISLADATETSGTSTTIEDIYHNKWTVTTAENCITMEQRDNKITATLDNGVLTVAGTGAMPVLNDSTDAVSGTQIQTYPWTDWRGSVKKIVISNGITGVGSKSFIAWENVTAVELGNDVKTIGAGALAQLTSCTQFTVSESNRYLEADNGVLYSKGQKKLYYYPCAKSDVANLTVPNSVTELGYNAICRNASLQTISFAGDNALHLGFGSLFGNTALATVNLGRTNVTLDTMVFNNDAALKVVYCKTSEIKAEVNKMIGAAGSGAVALLEGGQYNLQDGNGYVYAIDSEGAISYGYKGKETELVIPAELGGKAVTTIASDAFSNLDGSRKITKVTIPASVKVIESYAFVGYKDASKPDSTLTNVTILGTDVEVGTMAFARHTNLRIDMTSVEKLNAEKNAFYGVSNIIVAKVNQENLRTALAENDSLAQTTRVYVDTDQNNNFYWHYENDKWAVVSSGTTSLTDKQGLNYTVNYAVDGTKVTATAKITGYKKPEGSAAKELIIPKTLPFTSADGNEAQATVISISGLRGESNQHIQNGIKTLTIKADLAQMATTFVYWDDLETVNVVGNVKKLSNCFGGGNSLKKAYFGNQDNIVLGSAVFGNSPSLDVIDLSEVKNVEMISEPGYDNRITNFYGMAGITMVYVENEDVYKAINTVSFASTIKQDNGKTITTSGFNKDHNIVAITNGGTFDAKPTSNTTLAIPTKTGYTFDGWYSSSNFAEGTKLTDNNHPVTGTTYYAKWTKKTTPAIAIKATPDTLTGGGSVELTVSGVPTEGQLAVTCDNDIKVTEKDGKYTAALPNETKDYTFKADYTGTHLYNNASDTCVVSVTYKGSSHHSSSSSSSSTSNTVSASTASNGKVSLNKSTAKKGDTVTVTVTPDAGYQLDKLTITDAKGKTVDVTKKSNGKYTFTMPDSKVTITPTFSKIEDTKPSKNGFDDVASSDWFADAVKYVSDKGLMSGTGSDKFAPSATTTRAMLMTVLARYAGEDTTGGATWYEKGMNWAKANGVSDGTNPNANITREQLVTMLYRYAGTPAVNGSLSDFSDAASVSSYAVNAMQWAVANGIVNGSNGKLNPQNNATRAQVAAILMRFCEMSK